MPRRGSLAKERKRGRKRKNIIKEQINTKCLWGTLVSIHVISVADEFLGSVCAIFR